MILVYQEYILIYKFVSPVPSLRGIFIRFRLVGQAPEFFKPTWFYFLLINHPILWWIYIIISIMAWKQGWINVQGWMWYQYNMDNLTRCSTCRCCSFSLLLLSHSGVMVWCGGLLIYLYGLVFEPNWGSAGYLHTRNQQLNWLGV